MHHTLILDDPLATTSAIASMHSADMAVVFRSTTRGMATQRDGSWCRPPDTESRFTLRCLSDDIG